MPTRILFIDDNPDYILFTKRILQKAKNSYQLDCVTDAREGLNRILGQDYGVVLCDYRMPGLSALDILKEIRIKGKDLPFIVVTVSGDIKAAVDLMKEGAYDYILKDLSYEEALPLVITRSIERYKMKKDKQKAEKALEEAYHNLKNTQEQLIQSGKMAAIGQLASGISHELNQPLTGVKGFAQAALMDLDENNHLRGDLDKIIAQADRMDKIIKNVRFFARKSEFKLETIDINKPLENSLMFLAQQFKVHNIQLNTFLDKKLPKIRGDMNQLVQVFLNLISNARDAIDSLGPKGGKITIETALSKDKKNIEVTFKDTGCGIPKKDLENVFNPFFTTKSPGGGMGLGLSIVYRIIENHQGKIEVSSIEREWTKFRIILPVYI